MENLITALGGYNSWQFAVTSIGGLGVGIFLLAWKTYFIPLPIFCSFLLFFYLNNTAQKALESTEGGLAQVVLPIMPVLVITVVILVLVKLAFRKKPEEKKGNTDSTSL